MRFLCRLVGAVLGAIIGSMGAFTIADLTSGGNPLAEVSVLLIAGPLGLLFGLGGGIVLACRVMNYLQKPHATRRRKVLLVLGFAAGVPALVAGMILLIRHHDTPPPDQQLLANFRRHQETFDQVIRMLQTDKGLIRVDEDWTDPDDPGTIGVSPARLAEYRRLLRRANVPRGFGVEKKSDEVEFYYWLHGSAISSHTNKGYVCLTKRPAHLLEK